MSLQLIKIRPFRDKDANFIFATWLRRLWFSPDNTTTLSKNTFMRLHHARIERLLREDTVRVVCLKEDEDVILGYKVGKADNSFCYFKTEWRRLGLEQLLGDTDEQKSIELADA